MMYKTAIITSVYNSSLFLLNFLDNIKHQKNDHEYLHYVVNCEPHDFGVRDELHDFLISDKHCLYFELDYSFTVYEVWNYVLKDIQQHFPDTEYVTNANVDDLLLEDCLRIHEDALETNKDVDLVYCRNLISNEPNRSTDNLDDLNVYPTAQFSLNGMLKSNLPHNHPMWRISLHDRFGLFDTTYKYAADWEFWLRCAFGGSKFKLIDGEPLGLYYWNPQGQTTNQNNLLQKTLEENQILNKYSRKKIGA
mgnify:CR=1 FL=1